MSPAVDGQPMLGRACLVTGASAGIGRATALGLARLGATVLIAGRDPAATAAAATEVRERTGNPDISFLLADFSSRAQVRNLAAEVSERHERLDVLVNNAGTTRTRRELTVDGIEAQLAVNHLAPYLLTRLLLPQLLKSPSARVVIVSSDIHRRATLDFDDLQGTRGYRGSNAYGQSKLANLAFAFELARRLEGTTVTANALHPGIVAASDFARNYPPLVRPLVTAMAALPLPFLSSVEEAATTSIHLASSAAVEGISGQYFVRSRSVPPSTAAMDPHAWQHLWDISASLTGLSPAILLAGDGPATPDGDEPA